MYIILLEKLKSYENNYTSTCMYKDTLFYISMTFYFVGMFKLQNKFYPIIYSN